MNELKRVFVQQGTQLLQLMRAGFKSDNRQLIQQTARSLRNHSQGLGLDTLTALCEQVEESTQRVDSSSLEFFVLIQHLENQYAKSLEKIKYFPINSRPSMQFV